MSLIDALQAATAEQDTTKTAKVGATANIDAEMEEMHKALRRLRAIVPNVYEDNPAKPRRMGDGKPRSHFEEESDKHGQSAETVK